MFLVRECMLQIKSISWFLKSFLAALPLMKVPVEEQIEAVPDLHLLNILTYFRLIVTRIDSYTNYPFQALAPRYVSEERKKKTREQVEKHVSATYR